MLNRLWPSSASPESTPSGDYATGFPNAPSTSVCQGLELGEDKAASQIVFGCAKLFCHRQIWKALRVAVTPQRARAGPAIAQVFRDLPCPRLGAAIQSSCREDCFLKLAPDGLLPLRVREVMGRVQRPIHRKAPPTTVEECLAQWKVGATKEVHHKRWLFCRGFG